MQYNTGMVLAQRSYGWRMVLVLGGVAALTAVLWLLHTVLVPSNLLLCYVLLVLGAARWLGRAAAIVASLAAFLTYNFLFVPPLYTLRIERGQDLLEVVVFLGVSLVVGTLAARERTLTITAQGRAAQLKALYQLSQQINAADDLGELLPMIATTMLHVLPAAGAEIVLLLPGRPLATAQAGTRSGALTHCVSIVIEGKSVGELRAWNAQNATNAPETLVTLSALIAALVTRTRAADVAIQSQALREADRLKSALLSSVSHDLRTPLAIIKGAASNLADTSVQWDAATQQAFADTIVAEADRLNRLMRNLLEMSRLEADAPQRQHDLVEIGAVITTTLQRLAPVLAEHHLVLDIAPELPLVAVDAVQIELVLSNLLENAAKFAPPSTTITITAEHIATTLQVSVADEGPGIPPVALPHIFEKFYRVAVPEHGPGGSGLGLAICQGIVEAHGGRIWAEGGPHGGTVFRFTLPLGTAQAPVVALAHGAKEAA